MALRCFGTGAETLLLVVLLDRIAQVGRPFAQAHVKPPLVVRILNVFLRAPFEGTLRGRGLGCSFLVFLEDFLEGVSWASACWATD